MSPLRPLVSLLARGVRRGCHQLPRVQRDCPLKCEASTDPPTKQNLPKAKDYDDRANLHSLLALTARVTPTGSYLQAKSEHSPAGFRAQWHDLRLPVHHELDEEGEGTARPNSAICRLLPAEPLPPCVYPQCGHHL